MRTTAVLVMAAMVGVSLTACSTTTNIGDCEPADSGSVSDGVTVAGDFGVEPEVTFGFPLSVEKTQRTVEIAADDRSDVAVIDDEVTINYVLYNGSTGEKIESSYASGQPSIIVLNQEGIFTGLVDAIACSSPGDRVTGVIPPAEAFGVEGAPEYGFDAEDALVFVADVVAITPPAEPLPSAATGEPQPPVEGMPTVTLADDGTPTITIPDADPPTGLEIAVLKKGDGTVVADGDNVSLQYIGINWNTNTVFDQSWGRGVATFATNQVVSGFGQALVGQTVGSQVLVVIPPELGYGPSGGTGDGSIGATDTIVFVIDILATAGQ